MRPTATYKLCKKSFKRSQGNTSNLTAASQARSSAPTSRACGRKVWKKMEAKALRQVGLYVKLQLSGDLDFMTVLSFCIVIRPVNNFQADREIHQFLLNGFRM